MRVRTFRYPAFLLAAVATFLLCLAALAILFAFQLDRHTEASASRCASVNDKVRVLSELPSPRLVFIGGSSIHRGINAEAVGRAFGVQGANFGTFASLGPRLELYKGMRILKPGDTAVLAFEYDAYTRDKPTEQAVDFTLGCGADYWRSLPPLAQAQFVMAAPVSRILKLRRRDAPSSPSTQRPHGDIDLDSAAAFPSLSPAERQRVALSKPLLIRFNERSDDSRAIAEFVADARARNIRVLAAWPNTIYFAEYARSPGLAAIAGFYKKLGVPMIGTPQDAMAPASAFYDTQYHLRPPGIRARTAKLIENMRRLPPDVQPTSRPISSAGAE